MTSLTAIATVMTASTPFSPPSGLATGSFNGLHTKSKFLAFFMNSNNTLFSPVGKTCRIRRRAPILPTLFASCALLVGLLRAADTIKTSEDRADVVVYGATPSGIAAALAAKREGASVILVEELHRVGGMYTVGGMGLTDSFFMDRRMLDGIFEEIHARIDRHYRSFGVQYRPDNHRDAFPKDQGRWYHEPKVAEKIFEDMLREAGIRVLLRSPLKSVRKDGARIAAILLQDGRTVSARQYVDASYTGDLMAATNVKYAVGREGRNVFGESMAGKQTMYGQRKIWQVNPRDDAGKLLPYVNTDDPGPEEEGDHKIQNYNFRVNLTDDPANRVPFPKPANYDPSKFELFRRHFRVSPSASIKSPYPLPGRKFDLNDSQSQAFTIAIPGGSWDYPEADSATRRRIEAEHREFTLSYFHFILTDPSVPVPVREHWRRYGLPKDEHVDTGHFPPMIYIREARRMVGEHVLTQQDIEQHATKSDPVGMGLGPITIHNVQRVAVEGGYYHEGASHTPYDPHAKPFQIPYRSLLPKRAECENLLVPVCLSASHVAFSAVRLEPTWIVLGQSAGIGAALASKGNRAVHDVRYADLRSRLLAQKQVLDFALPRP
jgi:hypothetical protein